MPQMLSDVHDRLNLPRPLTQLPRLTAPPPTNDPVLAPAGAGAGLASRRDWFARMTGGALGGLDATAHARHRDPVLTLVHRITHGFSQSEYQRALALGFEGYLEEQLDHLSIDDSAWESIQWRFPIIQMSPKEVYDEWGAFPQSASGAMKAVCVAHATNSRRQLFERLCEFWSDHFNIDHNKGLIWALLPEHDRTVIRAHALGSFPAMLKACAFSAAMLYYLDNWLNVRSAPQNNYSRELLELHTLSVYGGYSQVDVDEVAKCFTGWTLNGDTDSPDWLRGTFDPAQHLGGQKLVLGHVIPGGPAVARPGGPEPRNDALRVLEILSQHPSTARFIATKLIERFLNPTAPPELVERVAETYLATRGDIKAMLRVILTRENLSFDSPVLGPKYKRPFHLVVSFLRMLDGQITRSGTALNYMATMGHVPYDFAAPTGYPDDFRTWGVSLLPRWTGTYAALRHDTLKFGIAVLAPAELQDKLEIHEPSDRPGLAKRMNARLFGGSLIPPELDILQRYIDDYPSTFDVNALYDCLVLAASMPGSQWY